MGLQQERESDPAFDAEGLADRLKATRSAERAVLGTRRGREACREVRTCGRPDTTHEKSETMTRRAKTTTTPAPSLAELLDELGELTSDLAYGLERLVVLDVPLPADLAGRVGLAARRAVDELSEIVALADALVPTPRLERIASMAPARGFRLRRRRTQQADAAGVEPA